VVRHIDAIGKTDESLIAITLVVLENQQF